MSDHMSDYLLCRVADGSLADPLAARFITDALGAEVTGNKERG
jgi:hypothetical protein